MVIVGPTAVGKTALSINLARHFQTEIISADSRQIFRELTIGTAKPSEAELALVKHHFINSHSILQEYDAARFGHEALTTIHNLFAHYNVVVMCGGSGLYVKAVCEGFDTIPEIAGEIRDELVASYEKHGISWLQDKMKELDPELLLSIDQQNPQRLMRALEVRIGTGSSIASFRKKERINHPFTIVKVGLDVDRDLLYHRIDERMDEMIAGGLFEEAEALHPYRNHNALQTVGYQEIFDFMEGKYDRQEAIRLLKRNSRRYAKRQLTWFKRDETIRWFKPDQLAEIVAYINLA